MGFGRRVIGDKAFAQQQARTVGKAGFGPRVIGKAGTASSKKHPAPAPAPAPAKAKETEKIGMSVEQFLSVLKENPSFLEPLYLQELEHLQLLRQSHL